MADQDEWCSINEAARRLGVTPTAIRNRIKRGTLEHRPNGNMGKLVRVPRTVPLTVPEPVPLIVTPTVSEPLGGTVTPGAEGTIKALEAHVRQLSELLDRQRADHSVELERIRDELNRARLDADQWRETADRERAMAHALFDRIKDMADSQARDAAEATRLRAELEQARRPWWRRLIGQ